jgi:hypothetical protein
LQKTYDRKRRLEQASREMAGALAKIPTLHAA